MRQPPIHQSPLTTSDDRVILFHGTPPRPCAPGILNRRFTLPPLPFQHLPDPVDPPQARTPSPYLVSARRALLDSLPRKIARAETAGDVGSASKLVRRLIWLAWRVNGETGKLVDARLGWVVEETWTGPGGAKGFARKKHSVVVMALYRRLKILGRWDRDQWQAMEEAGWKPWVDGWWAEEGGEVGEEDEGSVFYAQTVQEALVDGRPGLEVVAEDAHDGLSGDGSETLRGWDGDRGEWEQFLDHCARERGAEYWEEVWSPPAVARAWESEAMVDKRRQWQEQGIDTSKPSRRSRLSQRARSIAHRFRN